MGFKLSGIAINERIDDLQLLKNLGINHNEIVNKETVNFDELESDFTNDKNIAFCKTEKGTFVFSSIETMSNHDLLKELSINRTVISFYCYDTTATYCLDIFENENHTAQLWASDDDSFVIEGNFGIELKSYDTQNVNSFILNKIKEVTNINFSIVDLKRKCTFYDYKPEDHLSIPLKKKEVEIYLAKRLTTIFEKEKFKFIKSWGHFKKLTKTSNFIFSLGYIKEKFDFKIKEWHIEINPHITITNKTLNKKLKEKNLFDTDWQISASLYDILSGGELCLYKSYKLYDKEDVDNFIDLIVKNFHNKILNLFETCSSENYITDLYLKKHHLKHHIFLGVQLKRLKLASAIAELLGEIDLQKKIDKLYEKEVEESEKLNEEKRKELNNLLNKN